MAFSRDLATLVSLVLSLGWTTKHLLQFFLLG